MHIADWGSIPDIPYRGVILSAKPEILSTLSVTKKKRQIILGKMHVVLVPGRSRQGFPGFSQ